MDFGAVLTATCLSTAFATALMALLANYPIAVAPAMGHNFFFAYSVVIGMQVPWRVALGAVAIAGLDLRAHGRHRAARAADHGDSRVAQARHRGRHRAADRDDRAAVGRPHRRVAGHARDAGRSAQPAGRGRARRPGADRRADGAAGAWRVALGHSGEHGDRRAARRRPLSRAREPPPSLAPTFLQLDIAGAFAPGMVAVVFVFFFLALFDSVGTLVGVGEQAGLMRDGTLPRARRGAARRRGRHRRRRGARHVDGHGLHRERRRRRRGRPHRTGQPRDRGAVPAVAVLLSARPDDRRRATSADGVTLYPVIAAPLILVGTMMIGGLRHVAWDDPTEAIPAFLTIIMMPLAVSITEGVAFGADLVRASEAWPRAAAARCIRCSIAFAALFLGAVHASCR